MSARRQGLNHLRPARLDLDNGDAPLSDVGHLGPATCSCSRAPVAVCDPRFMRQSRHDVYAPISAPAWRRTITLAQASRWIVNQSSAPLEAAYNRGKIAVGRVIPGSASMLIERLGRHRARHVQIRNPPWLAIPFSRRLVDRQGCALGFLNVISTAAAPRTANRCGRPVAV
jgi:hypothetical protein